MCFIKTETKCGGREQCSKSKVQKKNTKQEQNTHGALQKLEGESGTMDKRATSHPPCALCGNRKRLCMIPKFRYNAKSFPF